MATPLRLRDYLLLAFYGSLLSAFPLLYNRTFTVHETVGCVNVREMRDGGDLVIPYYGGRPWLERPPLPFWLTLPVVAALGDVGPAYRLPPALVAVGCVLLVGWMASLWYGRAVGLIAGLALATVREFTYYSTAPECDMFLCGVVASALALFVHLEFRRRPAVGEAGFFVGKRPWQLLAFFVVAGLANLVKGLVFGDLMIFLPVAAFLLFGRDRWAVVQRYVWLPGWLAFAAAASAWALAAYGRYPDIVDLWKSDYVGRYNQGYMREPAWYYLVHLPWVLFPWTIAAFVGLGCTWRRALTEGRTPERFLWCWAIVPVVFFSLPQGKHHHYLLHLAAPWAVLAALGTVRVGQWLVMRNREMRLVVRQPAIGGICRTVFQTVRADPDGLKNRPTRQAKADGTRALVALFAVLAPLYWLGHALAPRLQDRYSGDLVFLDRVRDEVPAKAKLLVLDACGPLDASWMLYHLPGRAEMLHNATFLRDERFGEEVYLITRRFHAPLLAEYGASEALFESVRSRDEREGAHTRYGLYRLRLHPGLARGSGPLYISPMQATGRAPGPEMTGQARPGDRLTPRARWAWSTCDR